MPTASKGHLVLQRAEGEVVLIGEGENEVRLVVQRVAGKRATLSFTSDRSIKIDRLEKRGG